MVRTIAGLLTVSGRTVANLAMLAPGIVPRSGVGEPVPTGAQPRGGSDILVDGVSNKMITLNTIRSNAPPDAVEECYAWARRKRPRRPREGVTSTR